jgi:hypothetical protein
MIIKSLQMEKLNEDILSIVFSYNDYHDYANFYLVNSEWRYCVRKYTDYTKLLNFSNFIKISKIDKTMMLYNTCKSNEIKLVRWFVNQYGNQIDDKIYSVILKESCENKQYDLAEFILSLNKFNERSIIDIFLSSCIQCV